MGSAAPNSLTSSRASLRTDHDHLLTSLLSRKANALVHIYRHGFSGFAARLSEEEAGSMARKPGVVSVFPDPLFKLHTTHSWDFLKYQTALEIHSFPHCISDDDDDSTPPHTNVYGRSQTALIIPSRWKGTCMKGPDFTSSNCNRKLIGARFYNSGDLITENDSPRDLVGHGTHVASTAAGSVVPGASYYGLAAGTAMYKVCTAEGCFGSAILAAFDDAIRDGGGCSISVH